MRPSIASKDDLPILSPGYGFHLQDNGQWKVEKIPPEVVKSAEFSGYLMISGYESIVFDTPDFGSWAQKNTEVPEGQKMVESTMKPSEMAAELRRIASAINNSKAPSKHLVVAALTDLLSKSEPTQTAPKE